MLKLNVDFSKGIEVRNQKAHSMLQKVLSESVSRGLLPIVAQHEVEFEAVYEQIWDLYRLLNYPCNNFVLLSQDKNYTEELLTSVARMSKAKLITSIEAEDAELGSLLESANKELLEFVGGETRHLVFTFSHTGGLDLEFLAPLTRHLDHLLGSSSDLEASFVDKFISIPSMATRMKYLNQKNPEELDREAVLQDISRKLYRNVHFCVLVTDPVYNHEFASTHPSINSLWPTLLISDWNENLYSCLSQHLLKESAISSLEQTSQLLYSIYQGLQKEYQALFYTERGLALLSPKGSSAANSSSTHTSEVREELLRTWQRVLPDDSHNPYYCFKNSMSSSMATHESYFSKQKFTMFNQVYTVVLTQLEQRLKDRTTECNQILKSFEVIWKQHSKLSSAKEKSILKDTEIQLEVQSLTHEVQQRQDTIATRVAGLEARRKELYRIEMQIQTTDASLRAFETEHTAFTESIIQALNRIDDISYEQYIESARLGSQKSRLLPLAEILCCIMTNTTDALSNYEEDEAFSTMLKTIDTKYELLRFLSGHRTKAIGDFIWFDLKATNRLERKVARLSEIREKDLNPCTKALLKWAYFYFKEIVTIQSLEVATRKMEQSKADVKDITKYLESFEMMIEEAENEVKQLNLRIEQLLKERGTMRPILEQTELGHNRLELLFNSLKILELRYKNRLQKYLKLRETVSGDAVVLAINIVFMGNLSSSHRFEVIRNLLSRREITTKSDTHVFSSEWLHNPRHLEDTYKAFLKIIDPSGLSSKMLRVQFTYNYSRLNLYEFLLNQKLFWSSPGANSSQSPQAYIYTNIGCDPSTLTDLLITENEDQHPQLQTFYQHQVCEAAGDKAVQIAGLKRPDRRKNNKILRDELEQFNSVISQNCISSLNELNIEDAWVELKGMLVRIFKVEDYRKVSEYRELYINSKLELMAKQKEVERLVGVPDKNFGQRSLFEKYERELKTLEELQDVSREFYSLHENFFNDFPLLSTYSNILTLLYHSLTQFGNLMGTNVYSWFQYSRICEAIAQKLLRELSNKQKQRTAQKAQETTSKRSSVNRQQEEKSPRVTAITKGDAAANKNYEILTDNHQDKPEESKVVIKEGSINASYFSQSRATKEASIKRSKQPIREENGAKKQGERAVKDQKTTASGQKELDVEFTVDEHFFFNYLLPGVWNVLVCSVNYDNIPLLSLVFALNVGMKKGSLSENELDFFMKYFTEIKDFSRWKSQEFLRQEETSLLNKETLDRLESVIVAYIPDDFSSIFETMREKYSQTARESSLNRFIHQMLRQDLKKAALIKKVLLSLFALKADIKSCLMHFIHDELTSLFDYQEDLLKIHSFIKTATWHMPVAIFSDPSINTINTFCSIGSYYEVELEVLQIGDFIGEQERLETLTKIEDAMINGSWIVIHSRRFVSFWKDIVLLLSHFRDEGKIVNSFRLVFDFQEVREMDVDPQFLYEECVIYYLTHHNMEDMEGYNDVWANILNQNLLDFQDRSLLAFDMSQGMNDSLGQSGALKNIVSAKTLPIEEEPGTGVRTHVTSQNAMMILDEFGLKAEADMSEMSRIQSKKTVGFGREDSTVMDVIFQEMDVTKQT